LRRLGCLGGISATAHASVPHACVASIGSAGGVPA
jgi:hypothetical protein